MERGGIKRQTEGRGRKKRGGGGVLFWRNIVKERWGWVFGVLSVQPIVILSHKNRKK